MGKHHGWDEKQAFESLEREFEPDAPRFIDDTDHAENYGTEPNPTRRATDSGSSDSPSSVEEGTAKYPSDQ